MAAYHVQNGRSGGLSTLNLHGGELTDTGKIKHFSDIGKLGGRPTWQETLKRDKEARDNARIQARSRKGEPY